VEDLDVLTEDPRLFKVGRVVQLGI